LSQVDGSDHHRYFKSAVGKDRCTVCSGKERTKTLDDLYHYSWKILIDVRQVMVLKSHAMTTNEFVRMNTHGLPVREVYVIR